MTTPEPWFEIVSATTAITQGDVIAKCPLLGWKQGAAGAIPSAGASFQLADLAESSVTDVVVMTQACDLEQRKVNNVVLCPAIPLSAFHAMWTSLRSASGQAATEKAWNRELADMAAGRIWNLSLLNSFGHDAAKTELRVVFFNEVYTLPRDFLESLLGQRQESRLRLRGTRPL